MGLLRKFFGRKRKYVRLDTDSNVCGLDMIGYDGKSGRAEYGKCDVYRMINISLDGMAVRHSDALKKGDIIEFHTKHCIRNDDCFSCSHFPQVEEKFSASPFVGKVVWRNSFMAGINIVDLKDKDKAYFEKIVRSGEF